MSIQIDAQGLKDLLTYPSKVIKTAKGEIEYAIHGEGPVILSIHGGPGGYDQGLIIGEYFRAEGFSVLSVSRPGYLGTPLSTGATLEEQADAFASLIEALGLKNVGVAHASAGGPSGYLFANRHPQLVKAQVAIDSVSMHYTVNASKVEETLFTSKIGIWLIHFIMDHFPKMMIEELFRAESTFTNDEIKKRAAEIVNDPLELALVSTLFETMGTYRFDERKKGVDNDLKQMGSLDALDLSATKCPTLVIHGESDKDVIPAHAEHAAKSIPGSELIMIPKSSHVGFFIEESAKDARKRAIEFFKTHLSL